jgi:D-alanyl-D-alanine carboxypeptidase/D-alanyl-D-alanine-endopeptidase (penicillin-binding protein 4)
MVKSIRKGVIVCSLFLSGCATQHLPKSLVENSKEQLLNTAAMKGASVGIAIFDEQHQSWVEKHNSDHYFTPASNTKILSCYVGFKFLGDSLDSWKKKETKDSIYLYPLGDPTFMHPEFSYQPIAALIASTPKQVVLCLPSQPDQFTAFGQGWAWDDYPEDYQPERSRLSVFGNVVNFENKNNQLFASPKYFTNMQSLSSNNLVWTRSMHSNVFFNSSRTTKDKLQQVPFITDADYKIASLIMNDELHPQKPIVVMQGIDMSKAPIVKSGPTDQMLHIMMHRSDNFFAEQVVLMATEKILGTIDEEKGRDTIKKMIFSQLPQYFQWADGSGLSRFNLNTPENFVAIMQQMKKEFGAARIQSVFANSVTNSIGGYYKNAPGKVYAKTGTLGNQVALSGLIYTNKGKELTFSVLVGNHINNSSAGVRKAVEQYLQAVMEKY